MNIQSDIYWLVMIVWGQYRLIKYKMNLSEKQSSYFCSTSEKVDYDEL